MMKLLFVPLLLAIVSSPIEVVTETPGCYSFDTSTDGWDLYAGPYFWKWSGSSLPDTSNIPSFYENSGNYMWFQDQATPPQEGSMMSDASVPLTLKLGDKVSASIFRHIIVGKQNDTDRPVLRFVTGTTVQNVLFATSYDKWEYVTVTCSTTANVPSKTALCCAGGVYPCNGYLRVEGQVNIRDELLVFDEIEINNDCTGPTPSPPSNCHCEFDTADLCEWSPSSITTGWIWSTNFPTAQIPNSPTNSPFIYIIDTSAEAYSAEITGVDNTLTTFTLVYYLQQSTNYPNRMQVSFRTPSHIAYFSPDPQALSSWNTVSYSCALVGCCGGFTTCDGTLYVETLDYVGELQHAAIDSFDVSGPGYCNGVVPPPPVNCWCTFDNPGVCGWSPALITTGWIWSYDFSTSLVPSPGSPFIYIIDTSAKAYSTVITGVETGLTSFTLSYYFDTVTTVYPNQMEVYFITTTGTKTYFTSEISIAISWTTHKFTCGSISCCGSGVSSCDGTFYIETVNSVGTYLHAGINEFSVQGAGVCTPVGAEQFWKLEA